MLRAKYSTNLELKRKHFDRFMKLIRDQIEFGGTKYAHDQKKEATDLIVDQWGMEWLLGTMNKYLLRFYNLQREKDLLKIASYCYIAWLKMGFHKNKKHDTDTKK